jgi:hypothetical protein
MSIVDVFWLLTGIKLCYFGYCRISFHNLIPIMNYSNSKWSNLGDCCLHGAVHVCGMCYHSKACNHHAAWRGKFLWRRKLPANNSVVEQQQECDTFVRSFVAIVEHTDMCAYNAVLWSIRLLAFDCREESTSVGCARWEQVCSKSERRQQHRAQCPLAVLASSTDSTEARKWTLKWKQSVTLPRLSCDCHQCPA